MNSSYSSPLLRHLRDQQLAQFSRDQIIQFADCAENLISQLASDQDYTLGNIASKITDSAVRKLVSAKSGQVIPADILRHDLRLLVEDYTDAANIDVSEIIEPVFKSVVWRDPNLSNVEEVNWVLRCQLFIARHQERYENNKDKLGPNVIMNYEAAQKIPAERVSWAHQQQTVLFKRMQRFFDDVDILICPCVGVSPFPHEQWYPDKINGEKLDNYIQWIALTWALTIPGNPVTAIPCGYEPSGTPFGLQIVGKYHDDRRIIGAAKALEEHFQGYADLKRPVPEIAKLEVAA